MRCCPKHIQEDNNSLDPKRRFKEKRTEGKIIVISAVGSEECEQTTTPVWSRAQTTAQKESLSVTESLSCRQLKCWRPAPSARAAG